jgi:hypothetical protein
MPKDPSKAFSKDEAFDAFVSHVFNDSRNMEAEEEEDVRFLRISIGKKKRKEKTHFTDKEAEGIKSCLGVIEKYANNFKENKIEEFRSEYNSKGRGALAKFLVKSEEAGVTGEKLMVALAVFGNIGGFEVNFENVNKSLFEKQRNEDFVETAKKIILKTTKLPENKEVVTYKEGFDELDEGMALEAAASSELSLSSGSRGSNNKSVDVTTVFDTQDYEKIIFGTKRTLGSDDFSEEPKKSNVKKRKNH